MWCSTPYVPHSARVSVKVPSPGLDGTRSIMRLFRLRTFAYPLHRISFAMLISNQHLSTHKALIHHHLHKPRPQFSLKYS